MLSENVYSSFLTQLRQEDEINDFLEVFYPFDYEYTEVIEMVDTYNTKIFIQLVDCGEDKVYYVDKTNYILESKDDGYHKCVLDYDLYTPILNIIKEREKADLI